MSSVYRDIREPNRHSFAPITPYNQAGYIWVAALYCIIFSTLVFLTRIWIKRFSFGKDDAVFAAAFVAQIGHVVSIFVALKNGLGRTPPLSVGSDQGNSDTVLDTAKNETAGEAAFVAVILLIAALALTKISLLFFMRRLMTSQSRHVLRLSYALICVSVLWALSSIIVIAVNCSPARYTSDDATRMCQDMGRKWAGIATVDVMTEMIIIAIPVAIVWPLKMPRNLKFQACSAFFFRIGIVATAIVHAIYVSRYQRAEHPSIAMVPAIIAAEAGLCWSLVSATIPNLKNFMKNFATGFGHGHEFGLGTAAWPNRAHVAPKPSRKMAGSSIPLRRLNKIWHRETPSDFVSDPQSKGYETDVQSTICPETHSRNSGGSQDLIIRKDVTVAVDRGQKYGKKILS